MTSKAKKTTDAVEEEAQTPEAAQATEEAPSKYRYDGKGKVTAIRTIGGNWKYNF